MSQSRLERKNISDSVGGSLVATHTRSIGIIHPPPGIRRIVDKTAQFVGKNGPEFVRKIMSRSGAGMANFNFLNASDPYHAYYQHRLCEFLHKPGDLEMNGVDAAAPSTVTMVNLEETEEASNSYSSPSSSSSCSGPVVKPHEAEQYTLCFPRGVIPDDEELDIIKLTAEFVAREGNSFLTKLTHQEINSPQFNFLKPTNSMYMCFVGLVEIYSKILMPPEGLTKKLERSVADMSTVLDRCLNRLAWEQSLEHDRKKAEDEIERERMQMAMIDWHDFSVVETIDFTDADEDGSLPLPISLEDVTMRRTPECCEPGMEADMEVDEAKQGMKPVGLEDYCDEKKRKGTEAPMRIVRNWRRPEERMTAEREATQYVVSPITGETVPINEMADHMRISLIDPRYMEQKERMMAKIRETTLSQDDEISKNIVMLSQTRPDIFGTIQDEIFSAVKAEIKQTKEVICDGGKGTNGTTSAQAMSTNICGNKNRSFPPPPPPSVKSTFIVPNTVQCLTPPASRLSIVGPSPPQPRCPSSLQMNTGLQPFMLPQPSPIPLPLSMGLPIAALPPPPESSYYSRSQAFASIPTSPSPLPQGIPLPLQDEPKPKRPRVDNSTFIPLDQFLGQHPGPAHIFVCVPCIGNLKDQTLEISLQSLSETIGNIKERIAREVQVPTNKQKLSAGATFLKDGMPLAYYNIKSGETLVLGLKERGGKK